MTVVVTTEQPELVPAGYIEGVVCAPTRERPSGGEEWVAPRFSGHGLSLLLLTLPPNLNIVIISILDPAPGQENTQL